jgi:hypothetical protein
LQNLVPDHPLDAARKGRASRQKAIDLLLVESLDQDALADRGAEASAAGAPSDDVVLECTIRDG